MAEVKWIKIVTNIFDDEKIRYIEKLPDGNSMIVLWFKILCLAGKSNSDGFLMLTDKIAYTDEMLTAIFGCSTNLLKVSLNLFQSLGMIEIIDNKIYLTNWERHQNVKALEEMREKTRKRVAEHRKNKQLKECNNNVTLQETDGNVTSNVFCSISNSISNSNIDSLDNKDTSIDSINNNNTNIPKNKEEFNKYGEYGWVKLKPSQYDKLKADFPSVDIDNQIKLLDEYVQSNGNKNKYKDFNLVIRRSIRDGWFTKANNTYGKKTKSVPEWFDKHMEEAKKREEEERKKQESEENMLSMEELEAIFKPKKGK